MKKSCQHSLLGNVCSSFHLEGLPFGTLPHPVVEDDVSTESCKDENHAKYLQPAQSMTVERGRKQNGKELARCRDSRKNQRSKLGDAVKDEVLSQSRANGKHGKVRNQRWMPNAKIHCFKEFAGEQCSCHDAISVGGVESSDTKHRVGAQ